MWKKKNKQCKACRGFFVSIDLRDLCTHCAFKIDSIDSRACDINGIREDMRAMGIPTSSNTRTGGFSLYNNDDINIWDDMEDIEDIEDE
jgi:hypothetical protein